MLVCLILRVMDLPMRSRLLVRASNRTVKASSTASACLSNPVELNRGRSWSSESRPAAAAAVHVRSQDGWGLPLKYHRWELDYIKHSRKSRAKIGKQEGEKLPQINPAAQVQSAVHLNFTCSLT